MKFLQENDRKAIKDKWRPIYYRLIGNANRVLELITAEKRMVYSDYIYADFIKRFSIKKIDEKRKIEFYITDKQREHQFADAVRSCKLMSPTKEKVSFRP
nr:hypothetical protein [Tanacetum cinerariifolium]